MSIQSLLSRGCSLSNTDLIYDASLFTYHLQPDVVADSYTPPWKPGWCANFQLREEGCTKRVTTLLSSCMLSSYLNSKWCFSMWTAVVVFTIRRNTSFLAFQPVFGLYWLMKMLDWNKHKLSHSHHQYIVDISFPTVLSWLTLWRTWTAGNGRQLEPQRGR